MFAINSGINDSTIWDMINTSVTRDEDINFRSIVMDNVRDSFEMQSFEDLSPNSYSIIEKLEEKIGSDNEYIDLLMDKIDSVLNDSPIINVEFGDKDWNESYRDMTVTFDIDIDKLIDDIANEKTFEFDEREDIEL